MPGIGIDHVVSCSSADKNHPAENLLKVDGTHKWKSAAAGESRVSVVLQFNKSSEIQSIDIGNEGSAFVEVLVGKATAAADQDFEVLLVASAFMSPLESRNGTNRNSVRMFGPEKLNKLVADKKWDRVKIVCTQPFSKLHSYGLSFVKFHSTRTGDGGETKEKKLGAFTLKDASDDDDGDDIQVGSLFANRSKVDVPTTPKGAAAVRAATKVAEARSSSPVASSSLTTQASNQRKRPSSPSLTYENNLKVKAAKTSRDEDSAADEKKPVAGSSEKTPLKKQSTSLSSVASSYSNSSKDEKSTLKKSRTEPPTSSPRVAFGKLMKKVIFVLSGFQNPYRGELRDKALELGATYKPDWGRGCTHLVCAFDNTPKYQQVNGKGKIVTKKWILDCHKQGKLLPWRKYRLGDSESPDESSSDEEVEEHKPPQGASAQPSSSSSKAEQKPVDTSSKKQTPKKGVQFTADSDSGGDTEDELRKVQEKAKGGDSKTSPPSKHTPKSKENPYNDSTDEDDIGEAATMPIPDDDDGSDSGLPNLPDFFADKHFFFYGDFEDGQQRLLTRYIAAYNGEIEDYMNSKVNFVITAQKWDDNFETALNDNPGLIFVKPKWIITCHERKSLAPYQPHIVVP